MTMFEVPVIGGSEWALYTQRTTLDGREYAFKFDWNGRSGCWYVDVSDQDDVAIASGIKVVQGTELLEGVVDDRLWPGKLFLVNLNGLSTDPGLDDFGDSFVLIYLSEDEFEENVEPETVTAEQE